MTCQQAAADEIFLLIQASTTDNFLTIDSASEHFYYQPLIIVFALVVCLVLHLIPSR